MVRFPTPSFLALLAFAWLLLAVKPGLSQGLFMYESSGGTNRYSHRTNQLIESTVTVDGFVPSGTFEWLLEGNVPPGVTLQPLEPHSQNRIVRVRGTVSAPGTYNFSVRATDTGSQTTGSFQFEWVVGASLDFAPSNPGFIATQGRPYQLQFTINGGTPTGPCEFVGGPVDIVCSISGNTGTLAGTPLLSLNASNVLLRVPTDVGLAFIREVSFFVAEALRLETSPLLVTAELGAYYDAYVTVRGGQGPWTVTLTSGSAPPGITLRKLSDGFLIQGRLLSSGTHRLTFTATERFGGITTAEFVITVVPTAAPTISSALPQGGRAGDVYDHPFAVQGGTSPYTWSVVSGSLPEGLQLTDGPTVMTFARLQGRLRREGTYAFSVMVSDASVPARTATQAVVIAVDPAPAIGITSEPILPTVMKGLWVGMVLRASGVQSLAWSASGLPPGLTLSDSGLLHGTPTETGTYAMQTAVQDPLGRTSTALLTITVTARFTIALPDATVGVPYRGPADSVVTVSKPSFVGNLVGWTVEDGTLPPGLRLPWEGGGVIQGTTYSAGVFRMTLKVSDNAANWFSQDYSITVRLPASNSPGSNLLPVPRNGTASLEASAGASPIFYGRLGAQDSGIVKNGTAFFEYRENGVLVSETTVPAYPPVSAGRFFVEIGNGLNTGVAIANPNDVDATFYLDLVDSAGRTVASSSTTVSANSQLSTFLTEAPFNAPANFMGSAVFTSTRRVGVLALSGLTNERQHFLMTTLPVISEPSALTEVVVPHYATGAGWVTQLGLMNPTSTVLTGTIQFFSPGNDGTPAQPISLSLNGTVGTSFDYSIPPGGVQKVISEGIGAVVQSGSVRIRATLGQQAPAGILTYALRQGGVTVSMTGLSFERPGRTFKSFVQHSTFARISSGIAIANPSSEPALVSLTLRDSSGNERGSHILTLAPNAQVARFLNDFPGLYAAEVEGTLIVGASQEIVFYGIRGQYNARGEYILTSLSPVNSWYTTESSEERIFPHLVQGLGFTTRIVVFDGNSSQDSMGTLGLREQSGAVRSPH
jgi:hypothetical protein